MSRFHPIVVFLFLGCLSVLTGAAPDPAAKKDATVKKIEMDKQKQVEVVGKIIDLVEQAVGNISGAGTAAGKPVKQEVSNPDVVLGIAQIVLYGVGPICTGIHLKPWIVLTTADCIKGKDVNRLNVVVTTHDSSRYFYYNHNVEIAKVTTDPEYRPGVLEKNLALLYIFARFEWHVNEFFLPHGVMTYEEAIEKEMVTYADHWKYNEKSNTYHAITNEKPLAADFGFCGELDNIEGQFCAEKMGSGQSSNNDTLNKVDLASPLYYYDGNMKRLMGIFMGRNFDTPLINGHLYQAIYPFVDWIEQYMHEHSLPPMKY